MNRLKEIVTILAEYRMKVGDKEYRKHLKAKTLPDEVAEAQREYELFVKDHSYEDGLKLIRQALS